MKKGIDTKHAFFVLLGMGLLVPASVAMAEQVLCDGEGGRKLGWADDISHCYANGADASRTKAKTAGQSGEEAERRAQSAAKVADQLEKDRQSLQDKLDEHPEQRDSLLSPLYKLAPALAATAASIIAYQRSIGATEPNIPRTNGELLQSNGSTWRKVEEQQAKLAEGEFLAAAGAVGAQTKFRQLESETRIREQSISSLNANPAQSPSASGSAHQVSGERNRNSSGFTEVSMGVKSKTASGVFGQDRPSEITGTAGKADSSTKGENGSAKQKPSEHSAAVEPSSGAEMAIDHLLNTKKDAGKGAAKAEDLAGLAPPQKSFANTSGLDSFEKAMDQTDADSTQGSGSGAQEPAFKNATLFEMVSRQYRKRILLKDVEILAP